MTNNNDTTLDEASSITIRQFCGLEQIGLTSYYKLKKRGLGPTETQVPNSNIIRISPAARLEWHRRMQELSASAAAELERARRRQQTKAAGKLAAQSDNHASKRRRRKKTKAA